ncbi:palmitoyltransferase ZDHHC13/17 [Mytilus galloprovincialis]|uniref:Palmitoyltransferase ZDHHC13/17 n=1 Tax=Mytilus galloprovincialis TaxID=29158 RepID=A0A8B6DZK1_MYTGA|nr:palmitoyltransferase ZDHHC13/17 [Mytilus galloprovincialis]
MGIRFLNVYMNNNDDYDDEFYENALRHKRLLEDNMLGPLYIPNDILNQNIHIDEIQKVVLHLKEKKAPGIGVISVLFRHRKSSIVMEESTNRPIPKGSAIDPRIPLNYKGISLLSVIAKCYSSTLNNRVQQFLEDNGLIVDEQGGFRRDRSCEDHVFSLNCLILGRKSTFDTFEDLKKAFDYVDRNLLQYKLQLNGIDGNMYNAISSLYIDTESCVCVNDHRTNWFQYSNGIRQGDNLSPFIAKGIVYRLFALFVNDLATEIKDLETGIPCDNEKISLLLYADDIVILTENENDMQRCLDVLYSWCQRWRLSVNCLKSNVMHFRKQRVPQSNFNFKIGPNSLQYVSQYKYLGIIFNDKMDFSIATETLATERKFLIKESTGCTLTGDFSPTLTPLGRELGTLMTNGTNKRIEVSTLEEAEFYANNGFDDILYAHPLIATRIERCKQLAYRLKAFHVMIESLHGLNALLSSPLDNGKKWSVYLEIDDGSGRSGVPWDSDDVIKLAKEASESPHIDLQGLYLFNGRTYEAKGTKGIENANKEGTDLLTSLHKRFTDNNMECRTLAIGNTPSCSRPHESMNVLTEFHPGNYIFYDMQQVTIGSCSEDDIACRLTTRIIGHKPSHNIFLIDCGFLALSYDGMKEHPDEFSTFVDNPDLKVIGFSQEIGKVTTKSGDKLNYDKYPIGSQLFIFPWHNFIKNAECGNVQKIENFIKNGISVNCKDSNGYTALHRAAGAGTLLIVKLLLQEKAHIDCTDIYGKTPLQWAAESGKELVVGHLIKKGASVNAKDEEKATALHWASGAGHSNTIGMLLLHGAVVNHHDISGQTALHWAASNGSMDTVETLLKGGAKKDIEDENGMTPYDLARRFRHKEVQTLIQNFTEESLLKADANSDANIPNEHFPFPGISDANEFKKLIAMGTFESYENRVYLAGPCNSGKSSLASILIGGKVVTKWRSRDGLIIYFGRNGILLKKKKMIPLRIGENELILKLLRGKPNLIIEDTPITEDLPSGNESDHIIETEQQNATQMQTEEVSILTEKDVRTKLEQLEASIPKVERRKLFTSRKISNHTAICIHKDVLKELKDGKYKMEIAPSDLVDFGGQRSFDMTHQLFIQHKGTFVLMFDGSIGLYKPLKEYPQGIFTAASILTHWVNSILAYCGDSDDIMPIIVFAATHSDQF